MNDMTRMGLIPGSKTGTPLTYLLHATDLLNGTDR